MKEVLARSLFDKNVLNRGVEIEAMCLAKSLSCDMDSQVKGHFFITSVGLENDQMILKCKSTTDGGDYKVYAHNIVTIDGMSPKRIADVYGLDQDGLPKRRGNKRGRKPREQVEISYG